MPLDSMSLEYLISDSICKDSIYSKSDNWLISKNQVDCIKAQYQSFPPKSFFCVCLLHQKDWAYLRKGILKSAEAA